MRTKIKFGFKLLLAFLWGATVVSCSSDSDNPGTTEVSNEITRFEPIAFTSEERTAIEAAKPFGLDLFRTYCELSKEENVIISPLSAILDLGMLANGATDETQAEILEALGWGASGLEDMNSYARRLVAEYKESDKTTDVLIANGIFNKKDRLEVKTDYSDKMKSIYDAEAISLSVSDWEKEVSRWISDKSGGLIKNMDLGYENADLSLINALYFKGIWENPFDKEKIKKDDFTNSDGTQAEVEYLCDKRDVVVYQNEMWTAVELPFGNGAYVLELVKPAEETGIDALIASLDWDSWTSVEVKRMGINLRIPKFEVSLQSDFNEALKKMGIERIFNPALAQFGNIIVNPQAEVAVSTVKQGCSFSIDEEGVTAAATTVINMVDGSAGPLKDGGDFFLDHPFVFAIRENSSGAILFMGKIGKL